MYDLPEGRRATRGKSIMNFLSLSADERVTSVIAQPKDSKAEGHSLFMVTKHGVIKKTEADEFAAVRQSGLIAQKLKGDDQLVSAGFVSKGDDVVVVTSKGKAIRFKENDVREMGRTAAGVRAIRLSRGDEVVGARAVPAKDTKEAELLVVTANGYGKKTELSEYKVQKRGGGGVKAAQITDKTGNLMAIRIVTAESQELVAMSQKSQVVRTELKEVPTQGRATQGVRIMKLRTGDRIASLVCL